MSFKERLAEIADLSPLVETSRILTVTEDIDREYGGGHLHHTGSLKIFEAERSRIFAEAGMPIEEMAKEKETWGFIYEIAVKYGGQIMENEEVEVDSKVIYSRPTLLSFHQTLLRAGSTMVEAVVDTALVNKYGKPVKIPQEVLERLKG